MSGVMRLSVLMVAGALVGCASTGTDDAAMARVQPVGAPASELELRQGMRDLWADHVVWTRGFIVATVAGDPSAPAALDRLMKNQEDIGNAIVPYYGAPAGERLTSLLKDHIKIAGEVLTAAKANDATGLRAADQKWRANAADIATFVSGANPAWQKADLQAMLNHHLDLTTQEATARLQKNWAEDARLFDRIFDQAMEMADALSSGILRQFPART